MTITKEFLAPLGVMPVIVLDAVEDAVPVAQALQKGGITSVEITLRTPVAIDCIKAVKAACPDLIVGCGTVIGEKYLERVAEAGVDFAVSPGMTEALVKKAQALNVKLLPGVSTCSEVLQGMELGLTCFKLFPATAVGGIPLLKSINGPLPQVTFCPTGGLTMDGFTDFLALPNVACVGGSWLVPKAAVQAKDWQKITDIAAQTVAKIKAMS
ncbi:bifunctional 4-hydroxy-2-oxoglutarate aldolase/2-dehydro-3-deoxy-phosphogluconate aldolase [Marinagarivorans algicola]|uniref:bifunctional 4-hydroxy-2-oxoglutarate aldolase/2-dehydro-3-deoxy-phosphogluconate aldolase n=1 Tax=Marinagarivorans algicola TaxID=1513270 RepID=UPI0006B4A95E|nr:bifunctional 4-hydroxy-2-oxoglutarate aldolase/2-dehydro-3-deoxy-phosphogluconate aldolase [Marinagarivorans algicola]